ncbi:MAG: copper-binding protein [Gemmatimonadetes bacterium]|nr:copper-binding protein [Gemmatimonadota bacterium]
MRLRAAAAGVAVMVTGAVAPAPRRAPAMHVVRITEFRFQPETLTIAAGDSVRWENRDILPHTATAGDSSFATPELSTGTSSLDYAPVAGDHPYHCDAHPVMRGMLTVR